MNVTVRDKYNYKTSQENWAAQEQTHQTLTINIHILINRSTYSNSKLQLQAVFHWHCHQETAQYQDPQQKARRRDIRHMTANNGIDL